MFAVFTPYAATLHLTTTLKLDLLSMPTLAVVSHAHRHSRRNIVSSEQTELNGVPVPFRKWNGGKQKQIFVDAQ